MTIQAMNDLIERLQKIEKFFISDYGYPQAETIREAAAILSTLKPEGEPSRNDTIRECISAVIKHYSYKGTAYAITETLRALLTDEVTK